MVFKLNEKKKKKKKKKKLYSDIISLLNDIKLKYWKNFISHL